MVDFRVFTEEQVRPAKRTAMRIVAMLINLIKATEAKGEDMGGGQSSRSDRSDEDRRQDKAARPR